MSESGEFERFARSLVAQHRTRAAFALLALLFASAIYAPLIANDRPYVLEAIDLGRYEDARRTLVPVCESWASLIAQSPAQFAEQRGRTAAQDRSQAIAVERGAIENRLAILRASLSSADQAQIDACRAAIERGTPRTDGDDAESSAQRARAVELARTIQRELAPADPRHPERGGKVLHGTVTHPLCESLSSLDVFFMVLCAIVITSPAWNSALDALIFARDQLRIRRARAAKIATCLAIPFVAALVWAASSDGRASFATAPYKSAAARGDLVVQRAIFPPFAMGFAETNLAEANRPPTWMTSAEISDEGYYVHGARASHTDPITGFAPPPMPVEVRLGERERNAPLRHPLGTDSLGRDLFARLLWGGRTSLAVGLLAAILLTLIGTAIGAFAGYHGGRTDMIVSRGIEIGMCVPTFFLILSILAFTDPAVLPPMFAVVLVIAIVGWTGVARLVRTEFLRLRELEFVLAARSMGYTSTRIVVGHMLPNALGPVLVAGTFAVASSTLYESTLSFLGLGVTQPVPSWGALIHDAQGFGTWWMQVFPGACLFATVLAYNMLGEGVRHALDPRSAR